MKGPQKDEIGDWMPPAVDEDAPEADIDIQPQKMEVPDRAFEPIVRFDYEKRQMVAAPLKKKRAAEAMPDLLQQWGAGEPRPAPRCGPGG